MDSAPTKLKPGYKLDNAQG